MIQHRVSVIENVVLAERTYRLRLADPEIGGRIMPGQFLMLRILGTTDPLLGRPFALYDTFMDETGRVNAYDVVYLVLGKVTGRMSQLRPGDEVEVWGPLGNGFSLRSTRHLMMVAGGIGQTPFLAVAQAVTGRRCYGSQPAVGSAVSNVAKGSQTAGKVSLCYGVRSAKFLAGVEHFRGLGVEVKVSTDDGSAGHHGVVTDLVRLALEGDNPPTQLLGCGPEPMMHALARLAIKSGVPCELSLETPMACGVGACFSCVARIRHNEGPWDYRRVCVEGPVFKADRVEF